MQRRPCDAGTRLCALVPILQARTVRGYEPDGVHIMPWKFDADLGAWEILVSWQTGDARAGPTGLPLPAHDPTAVGSVVR